MSFTCFDKFKGVLDSIPDEADRKTMALAIIEYGLTGEDPAFGYPLSAIFEGVREDIDNSRDARGKNKGGRPKGSRNKPKPAPSPAPETPGEEECEVSDGVKNGGFQNQEPPFPVSETPVSETGNPDQAKPVQAKPGHGNPLPPSEFPLLCLKALSDVSGQVYTTMPSRCRRELERAEGRFGADQVRGMIEFKRDEWRAEDARRGTTLSRNLTPNTLFSPDHFEQYMGQFAAHRKEADRYAAYD